MATPTTAAAGARPQRPRLAGEQVERAAAWLTQMAPALLLALLAAGVPLFVWVRVEDEVVMPRLFGTGLLTGLALLALAFAPLPMLAWRAVRLPLALLAALVAIAALTTATSVDTGNSLFGEARRYQGLLPLIMYVLLFVAAMLATARARSPRLLVAGVFIGGTLAGGYAVLQKLDLDWVNWTGVPAGRVGGAFAQPNALGVELVTAGFASLALWREANAWQRGVIASGGGIMLAGLLFTLSRGAWVGALAGALVLGALWLFEAAPSAPADATAEAERGHRARGRAASAAYVALPAIALALAVAGAVALFPAGRHAFARALSIDDRGDASISAHTGLWRTSLDMVRDRPLLGGGPESFSTLFASYRTPDQPEIGTANVRPESAHNFFLDQAVGLGVPGAAIVVAFIAATLLAGWRLTRGDRARRAYALPLIAAVCAYYAAVFFSFADAMTGWLPWLLMGTLLGTAAWQPPAEAPPPATADAPPSPSAARSDVAVRLACAACAILLLLGSGAVLFADFQAGQAQRAAAAGRTTDAIDHARRASRVNPLDRQYLYDLAAYQERAAGAGTPGALADALATYRRADTRFAATALVVVSEARVMSHMWQADPASIDTATINARLEAAAALDPYNTDLRHEIAALYAAIGEPARAAPYLSP